MLDGLCVVVARSCHRRDVLCIVYQCPFTMLSDGGLQRIHLADDDDDAVNCLEQMAM